MLQTLLPGDMHLVFIVQGGHLKKSVIHVLTHRGDQLVST